MTDTTATTEAIKKARKKYETANAKREAALTELAEAMRAADGAGVARNEIQRLSGLARVTVYRLLGVMK